MAYTKIIVIRTSLNRSIKYAYNEEKTSLGMAIDYAQNRDKTEQTCFESALNCRRESAYQDMMATKARWKKPIRMKNGRPHVLGYHIIQSFKPGETDPETAHAIGCKFAERCFGDKYEVIISTHLDRGHLHNHIVINSMSYLDGRMYRNNFKDYYGDVRGYSDELCREYGLSVIEPGEKKHARHYAAWKAQKDGKPDRYTLIREDIDDILRDCVSMRDFEAGLRKRGYAVRHGNRKNISVIPPGWEKWVRLTEKNLGAAYSKEAIMERIAGNISGESVRDTMRDIWQKLDARSDAAPPASQPRIMRPNNPIPWQRGKITGIRALYIQYMHVLCILPQKPWVDPQTRYYLRAQHWRLEKTKAEMAFIARHGLKDLEQLVALKSSLSERMEELSGERKYLHSLKRGVPDDMYGRLKSQTDDLTGQIRALRREHKMCEAIEENSTIMRDSLKKVREDLRAIDKAREKYSDIRAPRKKENPEL